MPFSRNGWLNFSISASNEFFVGRFNAGRRINVRRHVEVMRPSLVARLEHRVVRLPWAGVERHRDLVLAHERDELGRIHRVDRADLEPAALRLAVQMLGESRIHVREQDALEAVVFVEFLPNHRANSAHADDHCVCHKLISSLPISTACRARGDSTPSARRSVCESSARRRRRTWRAA